MPCSFVENVKIRAIATTVPKDVRTAQSHTDVFGQEGVDKFVQMVGVRERHVARESQTTADFAADAAINVLDTLHWDRDTVDALVFVSQTPDYTLPATACLLQHRLNLSSNVLALDVNLGCSGFVYGLFIASSLCRMPYMKRVLLLGGDTITRLVSPTDKSSAMLFGDSGFAVALEYTEDAHEQWTCLFKTDGSGANHIIVPAGGFRNRFASREPSLVEEGIIRSPYDLVMDGTEVFSFTINEVPSAILELMKAVGVTSADIDHLVLHQANLFILKQIAKMTKFKMEQVPVSIDRYGNTSVSTIPLTLCDTFGGQADSGEKNFVFSGFGVGLSWGVIHLKLNPSVCLPISEI